MLLLKQLLSYVPTRLPVGITEFNEFAKDIIELTGPIADEASMRFVVATTIINLGPQRSHVAKNYFVRTMLKGAANQVASHVFQAIKLEQQEQSKAEATAKQQEAAANEEKERADAQRADS